MSFHTKGFGPITHATG